MAQGQARPYAASTAAVTIGTVTVGTESSTAPTVAGSKAYPSSLYATVSAARSRAAPLTWMTVLNSQPSRVTRCAEPTILAPPALMLYSPGQYSPGTGPIRAPTPSPTSIAVCNAANRWNRSTGSGACGPDRWTW